MLFRSAWSDNLAQVQDKALVPLVRQREVRGGGEEGRREENGGRNDECSACREWLQLPTCLHTVALTSCRKYLLTSLQVGHNTSMEQ